MRVVTFHKELAEGRWFELSLAEQLGNIGSEVGRTLRVRGKDDERFGYATERTLELFDLTLEDQRWQGRFREIARAREVFCDAVTGGHEYKSTLEDLDKYFLQFAFAARQGV